MSWIKKLLFLLIGIAVTSIGGVLILELAFGGWLRNDPWAQTTQLNIVRDKQIEYEVENLYGEKTPAVYSRDKYGLRGSCKNPNEIDILTIGGSTTDQRYIGDGQTYQDILQFELQHKLQKKICVSNAGVDGHSTFGHMASFKTWFPLIPGLKPKYFLLYIGINDAGFRTSPNAGFDTNQMPGESKLKSIIRQKSAIYSLLRTLRNVRMGFTDSRAYAMHSKSPPSASDYIAESETDGIDLLVQRNSEKFSQRLAEILKLVKQYGAKPICVSQPHLYVSKQNGIIKGIETVFPYDGKNYNGLDYQKSLLSLDEKMQRLCTKEGGFYLNIASRQFDRSDFYDGAHMTPLGAAKLGKYLFDEMEKEGIVSTLQ